jgi:hypothetical protein
MSQIFFSNLLCLPLANLPALCGTRGVLDLNLSTARAIVFDSDTADASLYFRCS